MTAESPWQKNSRYRQRFSFGLELQQYTLCHSVLPGTRYQLCICLHDMCMGAACPQCAPNATRSRNTAYSTAHHVHLVECMCQYGMILMEKDCYKYHPFFMRPSRLRRLILADVRVIKTFSTGIAVRCIRPVQRAGFCYPTERGRWYEPHSLLHKTGSTEHVGSNLVSHIVLTAISCGINGASQEGFSFRTKRTSNQSYIQTICYTAFVTMPIGALYS